MSLKAYLVDLERNPLAVLLESLPDDPELVVRAVQQWRAAARSRWTLRVLDAWERAQLGWRSVVTNSWMSGQANCELHEAGQDIRVFSSTLAGTFALDAAREAAAAAVFPTLDRNAPSWPGEKP